jgi:hypothetical protein
MCKSNIIGNGVVLKLSRVVDQEDDGNRNRRVAIACASARVRNASQRRHNNDSETQAY